MMRCIGIIPARLASSRFPGKPLVMIHGMPMIGHVYFRSRMCTRLDDVVIATCDNEIADYAEAIGAQAVMTSPAHERASDRVAEAVSVIEKERGIRYDIVVMIQGDEPMVTPSMIEKALAPFEHDSGLKVVNLMAPLLAREEQEDPNEVKVVTDINGSALYFSREPIPSWKKGAADVPMRKQVCIIPFRREFLEEFNGLESTPLEIVESVDMLRVLEHGYEVKMVEAGSVTYSVDTEVDLRKVDEMMKGDALLKMYSGV